MLSTLVLVINCGSSSLKFALVDAVSGRASLTGLAECLQQPEARIEWKIADKKQHTILGENATHREALHFIVEHINALKNTLPTDLIAIGHRIVHGGDQFTQPVLIDMTVLEGIKKYQHFAPLHNPAAIIGIEAAWQAFPQLADKNVAVFDTAFHQTLPEQAYLYALPHSLYQQHAIRRYGFHGTSHQFVSQQAAVLLGKAMTTFNGITCHLGNGASVTAIRNGVSIDTSMGLTPLEGLVMGTRCGDIDPAIIFYLYRVIGLSMEQIESLLTKDSGLLGLTGKSSDCRYLEQHYQSDPHAQRALTLFCYRLVKYIGAYATVLGDLLEALVFTGGIGENSALVREQVVNRLSILGFKLHSAGNLATRFGKSGFISQPGSRPILVIPTNEERMIAQAVFTLLQGSDNPVCGSATRH